MYKIVKDNLTIGMADRPNYIKRGENGVFLLCGEQEAHGIAYEGTPYHLGGMEPMEGVDLETVVLVPVDAGSVLYEQLGVINSKVDAALEAVQNLTLSGGTEDISEAIAILSGETEV